MSVSPHQLEAASDPNVLRGVPCCPGVVDGVVRVVKTVDEAEVSELLCSVCSPLSLVHTFSLSHSLNLTLSLPLSHSHSLTPTLSLPLSHSQSQSHSPSLPPSLPISDPCSSLCILHVSLLQGLDGEILVTARTDPGWVPLYPLCSGLIIERGRYV